MFLQQLDRVEYIVYIAYSKVYTIEQNNKFRTKLQRELVIVGYLVERVSIQIQKVANILSSKDQNKGPILDILSYTTSSTNTIVATIILLLIIKLF